MVNVLVKFLAITGILMMVTISLNILAESIKKDFKEYLKESECVRKHISRKIERKYINTGNGTCDVAIIIED